MMDFVVEKRKSEDRTFMTFEGQPCNGCKKQAEIIAFPSRTLWCWKCIEAHFAKEHGRKCVIEDCNNDRFEDCCYGMCGYHCRKKTHHYIEKGQKTTKYPNLWEGIILWI